MTQVNRHFAFGMEIRSDLVLPELSIRQEEGAIDACVEIKRSDHTQWPELEASPHGTPTVDLAPRSP